MLDLLGRSEILVAMMYLSANRKPRKTVVFASQREKECCDLMVRRPP